MTIYFNEVPDQWPDTLAFDLETQGLDPYYHKILSAALSDGEDVWIFLHFHNNLEAVKEVLTNPNIHKIIQNAIFDMKMVKHHWGIEIVNFYDTMLADNLITQGTLLPNDLKSVLARRLGVIVPKDTREEFIDHPGFHIKPITTEQTKYMANDVLFLEKIKEEQLKIISRDRLGIPLRLEFGVVPVTVGLELAGVGLDTDLWDSYIPTFEYKIQESEGRLRDIVGKSYVLDVLCMRKKQEVIVQYTPDEMNFGSPQQMQALFSDLTGTEVKSVNEKVLLKFKEHKNKQVAAFAEELLVCKHWKKALSWNYPKEIHPVTGRVHPSWHQMGTVTGRYSCSKPNLQNVPRPVPDEPNLRQLWIPDSSDYVLLGVDYAQQEMRIMALLCGDKRLIQACQERDVYSWIAELLYGYKVSKESHERFIAKTFALATGFGAGYEELSRSSALPVSKCKEIRSMIRSAFPGLGAFGKKMHRQALTYGYVTTITGRRRYFPNKAPFSEAVNMPIQGTAADMFKLAAARVHTDLKENKIDGRIWHIVHDELQIMVPRTLAEEYLPRVIFLMEEAGKEICPGVLHVAEGAIHETWNK